MGRYDMAREIPGDPDQLSRRPAIENPIKNNNEALLDAVEDLPEPDKSVVECLIWGGMTKVEVAEALDISRSYVHKIWRRARETLRQQLSIHQ